MSVAFASMCECVQVYMTYMYTGFIYDTLDITSVLQEPNRSSVQGETII